MRKQLKAVLFVLAALLLPSLSAAQTALTATTLGGTISQGQTQFTLASLTGITGQGAINNAVGGTSGGTAITTVLYIDRELLWVVSTNTNAKSVSVLRGQAGTQASAHASGVMVLAGPPQAFLNYDPEGYCANIAGKSGSISQPPQYTPWVNQRTSNQWLCSSVTNTWVPGYGNPGVSGTRPAFSTAQTGETITPAGPYFQFSGTTALVTINLPVGASDGTSITIQFTGSASGITWTAAGNIAVLGTATTALSTVTFTYSTATSKWIPSRVA